MEQFLEVGILFIGLSCSGKSLIINSMLSGSVQLGEYFPSVGVLGVQCIAHQEKIGRTANYKITEFAGQYLEDDMKKNQLGVVKTQISRNKFIVFTFDRRNETQFNKLKSLIFNLRDHLERKFTYLVGTFSDADEDKLQVSHATARLFALSNNIQYVPFSGLEWSNIDALFNTFAELILFLQIDKIGQEKKIIDRIQFAALINRQKEESILQIKAIQQHFKGSSFRKEILQQISTQISAYGHPSLDKIKQHLEISLPFVFV